MARFQLSCSLEHSGSATVLLATPSPQTEKAFLHPHRDWHFSLRSRVSPPSLSRSKPVLKATGSCGPCRSSTRHGSKDSIPIDLILTATIPDDSQLCCKDEKLKPRKTKSLAWGPVASCSWQSGDVNPCGLTPGSTHSGALNTASQGARAPSVPSGDHNHGSLFWLPTLPCVAIVTISVVSLCHLKGWDFVFCSPKDVTSVCWEPNEIWFR